MSYVSQNLRLFHVQNLSVLNFRIFLLMYPGSLIPLPVRLLAARESGARHVTGGARREPTG